MNILETLVKQSRQHKEACFSEKCSDFILDLSPREQELVELGQRLGASGIPIYCEIDGQGHIGLTWSTSSIWSEDPEEDLDDLRMQATNAYAQYLRIT